MHTHTVVFVLFCVGDIQASKPNFVVNGEVLKMSKISAIISIVQKLTMLPRVSINTVESFFDWSESRNEIEDASV